jgi:hypothetical protein
MRKIISSSSVFFKHEIDEDIAISPTATEKMLKTVVPR